jgi:hypothetical protein
MISEYLHKQLKFFIMQKLKPETGSMSLSKLYQGMSSG